MDKLILTDVDGVLLDWENHFHAWMHSQGHQRAHNVSSYWQEAHYPGLAADEAKKAVYHFNTSAWMIGVPSFKDARSGVARLVDEGYRFRAITAMGTDPYSLQVRKINLEHIFGYGTFEKVIATDMYDPNSKYANLYEYYGQSIPWIEDKPENAQLGHDLGLDSYLLRHPHNEGYKIDPGITCVDNWSQICDFILGTD